jgi:hypothetical protein
MKWIVARETTIRSGEEMNPMSYLNHCHLVDPMKNLYLSLEGYSCLDLMLVDLSFEVS